MKYSLYKGAIINHRLSTLLDPEDVNLSTNILTQGMDFGINIILICSVP